MSVFFSRFMGNESQCGTNKLREPRSGSRAIFCSALRFISHEPRKRDRSSRDLFVPHCDSFPMNREKKTLIPYIHNASNKDPF